MESEDYSAHEVSPSERHRQLEEQKMERDRKREAEDREYARQELINREMEKERQKENNGHQSSGVGLVIGKELTNLDPVIIPVDDFYFSTAPN